MKPTPTPEMIEAARIGDTVLSWLVEHDFLDDGNEYRAEDVLAVLSDLAPSAALSVPAAAVVGEPEGWKLVPVVPTHEILMALSDNRYDVEPGGKANWTFEWNAILAAAPSAPDDETECEFGVPEPKFRVGQLVEKASGYKWPGVVVSRFLTQSLQIRYVVECTVPEVAGALHIYSESQLVALGGASHE